MHFDRRTQDTLRRVGSSAVEVERAADPVTVAQAAAAGVEAFFEERVELISERGPVRFAAAPVVR